MTPKEKTEFYKLHQKEVDSLMKSYQDYMIEIKKQIGLIVQNPQINPDFVALNSFVQFHTAIMEMQIDSLQKWLYPEKIEE